MIVSTLAHLSAEDLARWRTNAARLEAMRLKSEAYNAQEIEQEFSRQNLLWQEFIESYNLPDDEPKLTITTNTGRCYLGDG